MYQVTIFILLLIIISSIQSSRIVNSRTITEKQGHSVILPCRFENLNERDRVMWSKDGVILSVKEELSGDKKKYEIVNKYDLVIKSVNEQDGGRYLCQNFDQAVSMNILLTVLTQPTKPDIQQTNKSLIENSFEQFRCITQGGNPLPTFSWFINKMKINESMYNIHQSTRQSYSELTLLLEKRFHNGLLTCQIENAALDKPLTTSYTLDIQYKPQINLRYGQSIVSNLNLLTVKNDRLTIDCHVESNPPLIKPIVWLKNGVVISSMTSSSLILQTIKRNDDGEYTCLAKNSVGHNQSTVNIRVQYPPIIQLNGGGIINETGRLILKCDVDAYPTVDYYQWYKNSQKLNISSSQASLVINNMSRHDTGMYICMVKNTIKYPNGSSIEKFNKTQTKVIVQYTPEINSLKPIIAADLLTTNILLECEFDSYPDATVTWKFNNKILTNSNKYSIVQNKSLSYLIIKEIQSITDYGLYSCNASNDLGYNSTTIQLRSKDVPEAPTNLTITNIGYSTISVTWKSGFDGGWPQSYLVSYDNSLWKTTNRTHFTFTNLHHLSYYDITVRAYNQIGESLTNAQIRVQTKDLPIKAEDLPAIEHSSLDLSENTLNYIVNNLTFYMAKVPLCMRIEIYNRTNQCHRLVTSSGMIRIDENDFDSYMNVSICVDQYEDFCGVVQTVDMIKKRETTFNWIFIVLSSIVTVLILIFFGLCIFCFVLSGRRQRRRRNTNSISVVTSNKKSLQTPVVLEPIISNRASPTKFFSSATYPEQQQVLPSYSKVIDMQKLDQFPGNNITNRHLSIGSSDPILSNLNSSSLSGSDHLTVADLNANDLSSIKADLSLFQTQYNSFGYGFNGMSIKEDDPENGYSAPLKNYLQNKKTVYEVVV